MKKIGNFELISQCKFHQDNSLEVYRSCKTGLHVILASIEGPVVNGYFTIVTEASSDDGLPHTLEHLVFLGSEDYPYKGILDLFANRCIAEGTNAWTSTDHTAYTIMTAGSEGFLNLLPIYLDHILYPTLTEAGFVTEVYHITGEGEDAGVVYSEMQASENTSSSLVGLEMMRHLYPEGSGYRYETGGIMANLRDSTSIGKIRDFHKAAYRPENLYVILTGQLDPNHVFKTIEPFEEKIISKGRQDPFTRPWQSTIPPIRQAPTKTIFYPSDSEDTGQVCAAWRGPSIVHQLEECMAVEILLDYLTHSSISPLPKVFIETDDPFASEVSNYFEEHSETGLFLSFEGVTCDKIDKIEDLLRTTLIQIGTDALPFDLTIMRDIITNEILAETNKMETDPHESLADCIVTHILYGNDEKYLESVVNSKKILEKLYKEESPFWLGLLKKYLIDEPMFVINAKPSSKESERLKKEVALRVESRKKEMGKEGLEKLKNKLEDAQRQNEIPAPDELLQKMPLASAENISYHSFSLYSNISNIHDPPLPSCPFLDLSKVPFKIELDDVKSSFVQLTAKLDISSLNGHQLLYLPLLSELLLESPIMRGTGADSFISHEEVIKQLNADTLFTNVLNGLGFHCDDPFSYGGYFNNTAINMKVSVENFAKGLQWMRDILFNVVITAERVKVKVKKLINSIEEYKRDGSAMIHLLHHKVLFTKDSVVNRGDFLVQEKFLKKILKEIKMTPSPTVDALKEVYKLLSNFDCFSLHLAANLSRLSSSVDLLKHFQEFLPAAPVYALSKFILKVVPDSAQKKLMKDSTNGSIVGLGSIESAYLYQTIPSINDFLHPDLPALMVAIMYLTQCEGPLWKEIRGQGLAYSYRLVVIPSEGSLSLFLGRAAQLTDAYRVTMEILQSYLSGSEKWNQLLYESAKSSKIYEIIQREEDISGVVQQSVFSYYRRVPHDYNRNLVKRISKVTLEEMKNAALKYISPLLVARESAAVVVCQASKEDGIQKSLQSFGHNLEIIGKVEESWIAQL